LEEIRATVATLRGEIKQLQLEWDETFDKIRRLTSRLAKRDALDARRDKAPIEQIDEPEDGVDEISARIHARRDGGS